MAWQDTASRRLGKSIAPAAWSLMVAPILLRTTTTLYRSMVKSGELPSMPSGVSFTNEPTHRSDDLLKPNAVRMRYLLNGATQKNLLYSLTMGKAITA